VFLGGRLDTGGAAVLSALRDRLGDRVAILLPDGFTPVPLLIDQAGSAASGVFLSLAGIAGADQLGKEGRQFAQAFSATLAGETLEPNAIYAAQAMEAVLDAIRRSDGTRASVLRALFETRIPNGLLGPVSFDRNAIRAPWGRSSGRKVIDPAAGRTTSCERQIPDCCCSSRTSSTARPPAGSWGRARR
jgi:hypothetical protein